MSTSHQERATGQDIVEEITRNLRESLEPLGREALVPSSFQVYLHDADHERLRGVLYKVEEEAQAALDEELARLNRRSVWTRFASLFGWRRGGVRRVKRAGDDWQIRVQEDPNGELKPGMIQVMSALFPSSNDDLAGPKTERIGSEGPFADLEWEENALARITYTDDRGPRMDYMMKDEILIGRSAAGSSADLRLVLSEIFDVSREHVRIRWIGTAGRFEIMDCSTLGTTMNGGLLPPSVPQGTPVQDSALWVPLPAQAEIGLAGAVFLQFEGLGTR